MELLGRDHVVSEAAIAAGYTVRIVSRARFWAGVFAMSAFVAFAVADASKIQGPDGRSLGLHVGIAFALRGMSLLPLVLPLVAGDLLASDVNSGYLSLQRARGAGPGSAVRGHLLGAVAVSSIATGIVTASAVITGLAVLPRAGTDPAQAFPFEPALLGSAPVVHVVLHTSLYALAGIAMLAVSTSVGAWSGSRLGAALAAPLVVLGAGVFLPVALQAINPLEQVMFANTWGAAWASADRVAIYWVVLLCVGGMAALAGLHRREARA